MCIIKGEKKQPKKLPRSTNPSTCPLRVLSISSSGDLRFGAWLTASSQSSQVAVRPVPTSPGRGATSSPTPSTARDDGCGDDNYGRFAGLFGRRISLPEVVVDPSFSFLTNKLPWVERMALIDSCNGLLLFATYARAEPGRRLRVRCVQSFNRGVGFRP
jgi:hypothetical protein